VTVKPLWELVGEIQGQGSRELGTNSPLETQGGTRWDVEEVGFAPCQYESVLCERAPLEQSDSDMEEATDIAILPPTTTEAGVPNARDLNAIDAVHEAEFRLLEQELSEVLIVR
jgi:hypothetical protein